MKSYDWTGNWTWDPSSLVSSSTTELPMSISTVYIAPTTTFIKHNKEELNWVAFVHFFPQMILIVWKLISNFVTACMSYHTHAVLNLSLCETVYVIYLAIYNSFLFACIKQVEFDILWPCKNDWLNRCIKSWNLL